MRFENEQTVRTHREEGRMDAFNRSYEAAIDAVTEDLGDAHHLWIDGERRPTDERFTVHSPGDTSRVVGEFGAADHADVDRAVRAAAGAFEAWRDTDHEERARIFRAAADRLADRKFEMAATLTVENGKNRTEATAEVDEAIDFLRFYSRELERHDGYEYDTGEATPGEHCTNVLEPYGVFGVIAPFNFPVAIFTGMAAGALLAGNTVVAKPAVATPLVAHRVVEILTAAGLPDGALNLVTGGAAVGESLVEHEATAGVAFTGSRAVGEQIQRTFLEAGKPGPVIAELGGKNPVVVTAGADLEKAVAGVAYGAFGFSGQKCSATARVYVDEAVVDAFTDRLAAAAADLPLVPPEDDRAVLAPLINDAAMERYRKVCARARTVGTVHTGGRVVDSGVPDGRYVAPTVVTGVPHDHELAREEQFLPFVTVHPVADLDEAIRRANDSEYGLCAGLFSEDGAEVERWVDRIEAGMCYVNRERSATTGALVSAQPFGGWKASGTSGKFAGGRWYLPQFAREQSRTVVGDVGR